MRMLVLVRVCGCVLDGPIVVATVSISILWETVVFVIIRILPESLSFGVFFAFIVFKIMVAIMSASTFCHVYL